MKTLLLKIVEILEDKKKDSSIFRMSGKIGKKLLTIATKRAKESVPWQTHNVEVLMRDLTDKKNTKLMPLSQGYVFTDKFRADIIKMFEEAANHQGSTLVTTITAEI